MWQSLLWLPVNNKYHMIPTKDVFFTLKATYRIAGVFIQQLYFQYYFAS